MISKELLSEVLGIEIRQNPILCNMKENYIEYYEDFYNCDYPKEINIYELAHKCKEWALDNKFLISTTPLLTELKWRHHSVFVTTFL